jgi:hypothetical protein
VVAVSVLTDEMFCQRTSYTAFQQDCWKISTFGKAVIGSSSTILVGGGGEQTLQTKGQRLRGRKGMTVKIKGKRHTDIFISKRLSIMNVTLQGKLLITHPIFKFWNVYGSEVVGKDQTFGRTNGFYIMLMLLPTQHFPWCVLPINKQINK